MMNLGRKMTFEILVLIGIAFVVSFTVNAVRTDKLTVFGTDCIKEFDRCNGSISKGEFIGLDKAMALFYNKTAVFVDARTKLYYSMGHIYGAINVSVVDAESIDKLLGISKETFIVVYDDGLSGSEAAELAAIVKSKGFPRVLVFPNGFNEWQTKGLPVDWGYSG